LATHATPPYWHCGPVTAVTHVPLLWQPLVPSGQCTLVGHEGGGGVGCGVGAFVVALVVAFVVAVVALVVAVVALVLVVAVVAFVDVVVQAPHCDAYPAQHVPSLKPT
jgi:hypothetical protein